MDLRDGFVTGTIERRGGTGSRRSSSSITLQMKSTDSKAYIIHIGKCTCFHMLNLHFITQVSYGFFYHLLIQY